MARFNIKTVDADGKIEAVENASPEFISVFFSEFMNVVGQLEPGGVVTIEVIE